MPVKSAIFLFIAIVLQSCIETRSSHGSNATESDNEPTREEISNVRNPDAIYSLFGVEFEEKQLNIRERRKREAEMLKAKQDYEADPKNEENVIWYGRRLAYLGKYQEAIEVFSQGIRQNDRSYRLLRHRGHRYITARQFDKAIDDLQNAAYYARNAKNELEPDGLPNKLNIPLSNDKYNIFYHLGIAYYLKGNYDKALSSFKKCMTFADNSDLKVACTDWFYMTYRKIGNINTANELLTDINRKTDVIENKDYLNRILVYKGIYEAEVLLEYAERENNSYDPTLGYGIGNWFLYNGNADQAKEIFERVLVNQGWDAFGYIAAEADLKALMTQL